MRVILSLLCLLLAVPVVYAKNAEFPGRDLYLDVKYIELDELARRYDEVLIVDVRSAYEYNTLHINKAVNISLHSPTYIEEMKQLRNSNPAATIVTYCNGKTCMKSYKAVRKCQQKGVSNIVSFDAGIMDWAKSQPQRSTLLGESPLDPARLISKDEFKKHLLTPEDFIGKANNSNIMIVDARDPLQREGYAFFMGKEKRASLSDEAQMSKLIDDAVKGSNSMYIYDQAGKQVRWLMYRLEQKGVREYYFMKGGANGYYSNLRKNFSRGD
jgi:rhodanese-related sulfurtransferase